MTRTFIASVGLDATKEQRDAFTNELRSATGVGFWHHLETTWIIRDPRAVGFTCAALRDQAHALMPNSTLVVMEVEPKTWGSFASDKANSWLTQYFK